MREYLFSDEVTAQDESSEPEIPPKLAHSLSGMGSSGKGTAAGKYEGFGNSPISKEHLGDKVLDLLESAMSSASSDGKDVVMKMCLSSSTGDYEPVDLPPALSGEAGTSGIQQQQQRAKTARSPKQHVPGKAGGGWESSDSEDERKEQMDYIAKLSLQSSMDKKEEQEETQLIG